MLNLHVLVMLIEHVHVGEGSNLAFGRPSWTAIERPVGGVRALGRGGVEVPTSCKMNQVRATFTTINLSHLAFRCGGGGVPHHLVFEVISETKSFFSLHIHPWDACLDCINHLALCAGLFFKVPNFFQESVHILRPHERMRLLEGGSWLGSPPWVPTVGQAEPLKGIN